MFETKTPQVGFCILNYDLAGFEKEERKEKRKQKQKQKDEKEKHPTLDLLFLCVHFKIKAPRLVYSCSCFKGQMWLI
jgi:hypothetical protein